MVKNKIAIVVLVLVVVALVAYFAYEMQSSANYGQNTTVVSLTNSSSLNGFNNTAANASISNSTLSGNITSDQNESALSNGNLIPSP